jgi:hypothetical protein
MMRFRPLLPQEIKDFIKKIQDIKDPEVSDKQYPLEYSEENFNKKDFYESPNVRIIDPLFVLVFYGLYESKELPPFPLKEYAVSDGSQHDFGSVDVTNPKKILNHLIFCLWVKQNGLPDERNNVFEYRKNLYVFLDNILEDEYFMSVIVPFYLSKALKSPRKFVDRVSESNYVKFEDSIKAPEYIAQEFTKVQEKFYEYVFAEAKDESLKNITKTTEIIGSGESDSVEFKSAAFWSTNLSKDELDSRIKSDQRQAKDLIDFGRDTSKFVVAKSIAGFLNSNGGNLLIGVKENKETKVDEIIGIESEFSKFKEPERSTDGYRRAIIDSIIRKFFHPEFYNQVNDYISIKFPKFEEGSVCHIEIYKAKECVFLNVKNRFFIRTDAETREIIDPKQIHDYCKEHFKTK